MGLTRCPASCSKQKHDPILTSLTPNSSRCSLFTSGASPACMHNLGYPAARKANLPQTLRLNPKTRRPGQRCPCPSCPNTPVFVARFPYKSDGRSPRPAGRRHAPTHLQNSSPAEPSRTQHPVKFAITLLHHYTARPSTSTSPVVILFKTTFIWPKIRPTGFNSGYVLHSPAPCGWQITSLV